MFPPVTWNEEEVLQLIRNTQEEFLELDFKRGDSLKNTDQNKKEISKDVSAFANTIGGTIVYGIEEDLQPPHAAVSLSPINLRVTTKEWLEQVINSNIQPRIPGIRITPINLTSVPDSAVYVVTIPEGATAYQARIKDITSGSTSNRCRCTTMKSDKSSIGSYDRPIGLGWKHGSSLPRWAESSSRSKPSWSTVVR